MFRTFTFFLLVYCTTFAYAGPDEDEKFNFYQQYAQTNKVAQYELGLVYKEGLFKKEQKLARS